MEWKGFSPGIAPTRRPSSRLWRHHSFVCNAVCSSRPDRRRPQPVRFARMSDNLCIWDGQQWITPSDVARSHCNVFRELEPGLTGDAKTCLRRSLDRYRRAIAEGRPSLT